jgi:uncharacterized OsmC-like protein
MSIDEKTIRVSMEREVGFEFKIDFGLEEVMELIMDEPEPVGKGRGPNASKVLAAVIGNCLSASLLFCLQKARVQVRGMKTKVSGTTKRNDEGRWRITDFDIAIQVEAKGSQNQKEKCKKIFEDYCVVSQSIKQGIPMNVNINWL